MSRRRNANGIRSREDMHRGFRDLSLMYLKMCMAGYMAECDLDRVVPVAEKLAKLSMKQLGR